VAFKTQSGTLRNDGATLSPGLADLNAVGKSAAVVVTATFQ
jgi:hypothetical protein